MTNFSEATAGGSATQLAKFGSVNNSEQLQASLLALSVRTEPLDFITRSKWTGSEICKIEAERQAQGRLRLMCGWARAFDYLWFGYQEQRRRCVAIEMIAEMFFCALSRALVTNFFGGPCAIPRLKRQKLMSASLLSLQRGSAKRG